MSAALSPDRRQKWRAARVATFAGLVMDADGLRLVVPVVVLDAHEVGVGAVVEARPHGQHVVVGLAHGLHQLQAPTTWATLLAAAEPKGASGPTAAALRVGDGAQVTACKKGHHHGLIQA